jgi:uncharacterized LabA/DUF88 family protein
MKDKPSLRMAVLMDGDNVSPDNIGEVIKFVSQYGNPLVKRIYGDWTKPAMAKWKEPAKEHSFRLIEALVNIKAKNATDIALVIDAMDLLHSGTVDGFCIVSSDSDFTLLAQRIRESGLLVLGYGESKTPAAFVNSCKKFMISDAEQEKLTTQEAMLQKEAALFDEAFEIAAGGNSEVALSIVGTELKKLFPKFKTKRYGCKTLGAVYQKLDKYELIQTGEKKTKNNVVRKKQN